MEAATVLGGQSIVPSGSAIYKPSSFVLKSSSFSSPFRFHLPSTKLSHKLYPLISAPNNWVRRPVLGRRHVGIRASATDPAESASAPIAPLQLESPIGQFLSQILSSHPHLLPAAVDQQLKQLQTDRDAAAKKEEPSTTGTDLVLYRRIAEVKANERKKALEEILYALIVQKFVDANVSMIPTISDSSSDPSGKVDTWPDQVEKLERVHSPEAYEMIKNHLTLILGNRLTQSESVAQISKLRVGQVYAASVMYGYFLKRVDQRFQLEKTMKTLPFGLDDEDNSAIEQATADEARPNSGVQSGDSSWSEGPSVAAGDSAPGFSPSGFGFRIQPSRLRSYVMSFDAETLQSYATLRSKEAVAIIEKHTEALFGRPEIIITPQGAIDSSKDEVIKISFGGLKTLILEAVTFGSFLWDVESYVDSRYHFVMN